MTIGTPDSARIWRQTSMPSMPGQHQVEQHQVGAVLAERADGATAPSAHVDDVEPLVAQDDAEHLRQRQVVVDDQHATLHVGPFLSPQCHK